MIEEDDARPPVSTEPMTPHEARAHEMMGGMAQYPGVCWCVVREPIPNVWYDWVEPNESLLGQCKMRSDGTWYQPPRGAAPVILWFDPEIAERVGKKN